MIFNWHFAASIIPGLSRAGLITISITVSSFGVSLVGGLLLLWLRQSRYKVIVTPTKFFINFMRGTPLLLQIYFYFYVAPAYGVRLDPIETGIFALGVHWSCYMAEAYRGALSAIPDGQWEALKSLGLSPVAGFILVIFPQMLKTFVPVGGSYLIYMFKDTPLLAAITVRELLQVASRIGSDSFRYIEPITLVGVIFLVLSLFSAAGIRLLEKRFSRWG